MNKLGFAAITVTPNFLNVQEVFRLTGLTLVSPIPDMGVRQRRTILSRTIEEYISRQLALANPNGVGLSKDGSTITTGS